MAKAVITIEDGDDGERVKIRCTFEPALQMDEKATLAQALAIELQKEIAAAVGDGKAVEIEELDED